MIKKILQKNIQLSYQFMKFFDQHGEIADDGLYRTQLKLFLESQTEKLKYKRVLDVGAGSWTWSRQTFSPVCEFITFDSCAHPYVDVVGDVYQLTQIFGLASFDIVMATDLFEHISNLQQALKQISLILKPDGCFIASTPFKKNLHGEEYGDYWRITRQGWKHLLEQTRFIDIQITWLGEELFPIAYFVTAQKFS